jgi:ornithine carbamoyltransferase
MAVVVMPRPVSPDPAPWADDDRALLDQARELCRARADGRPLRLMRGRNLGLLCPDPGTPAARLFQQAASELGAQVAHIQAEAYAGSADRDLASTARLLGRLYDAVECQGLAPGVAQRLAALSGNVVFDGLALEGGLVDRLVRQLDCSGSLADKSRFVLQALLLRRLT